MSSPEIAALPTVEDAVALGIARAEFTTEPRRARMPSSEGPTDWK